MTEYVETAGNKLDAADKVKAHGMGVVVFKTIEANRRNSTRSKLTEQMSLGLEPHLRAFCLAGWSRRS